MWPDSLRSLNYFLRASSKKDGWRRRRTQTENVIKQQLGFVFFNICIHISPTAPTAIAKVHPGADSQRRREEASSEGGGDPAQPATSD